MSAGKLLQLLKQSGMLEDSLIAELRKQVSESKFKVSAESIAKLLVDRGLLTKYQATKLVGDATREAEREAGRDAQSPPGPADKGPADKRPADKRPADKPPPPAAKPDEEDLGLAPDEDEELGLAPDEDDDSPPEAASSLAASADEEVVLLEDASGADHEESSGLMPVEDAGANLTPVGPVATDRPTAAADHRLEPVGEGALLGDVGSLDPFAAESAAAPRAPYLPALPARGPRWDTMLMYGGGLALALLLLFGGVLLWNLMKTPALEMFEAAMNDYRSESYSQAVAKFEKFLDAYPDDENASEARVRIVLSKLRLDVADPQRGLDAAQQLIPSITSEEAFPVAREELAGILPQIPAGFVRQAKQTDDAQQAEKLLGQAEQGMGLVLDPANIPTSIRIRIDNTIQRIQEDMQLVRRAIEQDKELAQAIIDIRAAVSADNTVGAYEVYRALIKKYPGLENNQPLLETVGQITARERRLVRVEQETLSPVTTSAPAPLSVVLAARTGEGSRRVAGQVAPVLAGGSVYGLDAGTGALLWRHYVGRDTTFDPIPVASDAEADWLLVDGVRQELIRCQAPSGKPVWRLPVGEAMADPVLAGGTIYVATAAGALLEVDAQEGLSPRRARIPQQLPVGPAVDPTRRRIFLAGEHSNLYVLSSDTLECKDVFYLGHKPGAVDVRPLVLLGHLFVVENAGLGYARLHVLAIRSEGEGPSLQTAQPPIRLNGNVRVPPLVYGRGRVLLLTDRGEIRVFDVDITDARQPVKEAASLTAMHDEPLLGYPLTDAASLWVADDRLTNYRIQVTTKQITRNTAITNVGDTFIAPLQLFQDVLVHARRVKDAAGVTVAAVQIDNPRKPLWETQLAMPVACVAADAEQRQIAAVTAAGALFEIGRGELDKGTTDQPQARAATAGLSLSFTEAVRLPAGRVALFNPLDCQQLLLFDPARDGPRLQRVTLAGAGGSATAPCSPVAFQDGVLVPTRDGRVLLADPASGEDRVLPFQPTLDPGEQIQWHRPAVLDGEPAEFVIADDRQQIYRVAIQSQPQPFLGQQVKVRLDFPLTAELAAVGDTVYGATHGDTGDRLVALSRKGLAVAQQWELGGGKVTWGPRRAGDGVLVVVDAGRLYWFDGEQKQPWGQPVPIPGQVVGDVLSTGEEFVLATAEGGVCRVSRETGQLLGQTDLGQPLGGGPVAFGSMLIVCGTDGTLHVLPSPASSGP